MRKLGDEVFLDGSSSESARTRSERPLWHLWLGFWLKSGLEYLVRGVKDLACMAEIKEAFLSLAYALRIQGSIAPEEGA